MATHAILSGCPSPTDSEVNKNVEGILNVGLIEKVAKLK